jgi:hypothetical protein
MDEAVLNICVEARPDQLYWETIAIGLHHLRILPRSPVVFMPCLRLSASTTAGS